MSTPAAYPGVEQVLSDPATSYWLKAALRESIERDPVDALNDALALAGVLEERLRQVMRLDDPI
jgi:hypothetical protein